MISLGTLLKRPITKKKKSFVHISLAETAINAKDSLTGEKNIIFVRNFQRSVGKILAYLSVVRSVSLKYQQTGKWRTYFLKSCL